MNKALRLTEVIAALLLLGGCSGFVKLPKPEMRISFADSLGNEVLLPTNPVKVTALSASFADMWLLAGGDLTGVTEDAMERGLSLSEHTEIIGSVKKPNAELILSQRPDLVLLSADIESHHTLAETLKAAGIPCAFCRVESFEQYLVLLKTFTDLTGRKEAYEQYGSALEKDIRETLSVAQQQPDKPSVLLIRALSTKAKALPEDNMVSLMVAQLGADSMTARHPSLLEELSMEAILQENPDFILIVPMGDTQEAVEALKASIEADPAWSTLNAVREGRYRVLDQELFHYKPNDRWAESYKTLYDILYGKNDE